MSLNDEKMRLKWKEKLAETTQTRGVENDRKDRKLSDIDKVLPEIH